MLHCLPAMPPAEKEALNTWAYGGLSRSILPSFLTNKYIVFFLYLCEMDSNESHALATFLD